MMRDTIRDARNNASECFEGEARAKNPQLTTLTTQVISFSQDEIAAAASLAYIRTKGTQKTITVSDILTELGIIRGSRIWEHRDELISSRLVSKILIKMGFSRLNTRNARYTFSEA